MSTAVETPAAQISEWKVVKGGLVVGAGLLAGQALGFIRQATIAYLLGTGSPADALSVAFAPVDLLWAALSTAVIFGFGPLLAAREPDAMSASFADLERLVVGVALATAVMFAVLAEGIVRLLAPGLPPPTAELAARLLRITALAIPAVAWSTLFTALLYSERRFAFAAFHQGMVNLCIIAAALLLDPHVGAFGFAFGYAGGAWMQLAAAYLVSRRIRRRDVAHALLRAAPRLVSAPAGPPDEGRDESRPGRLKPAPLVSQPAPVLCYSLLVGLNPVVTRALASTFGPGATAAFDYCLKLLGVPLALLVIPISSSLLSEIAPFRLRQDRRAALGAIRRAALATLLASGVMVLLMTALGSWIVALLFERGQFGAASTAAVTSILAGFFPALIAWSVLDVISRSLFSLGRPRLPILAAVLALAVNVLWSALLPMRSLPGIGLGAVVGFAASAALAAGYLARYAERR